MGAWIEIHRGEDIETVYYVAPYMGAWIEIRVVLDESGAEKSLPTWGRGLKYC